MGGLGGREHDWRRGQTSVTPHPPSPSPSPSPSPTPYPQPYSPRQSHSHFLGGSERLALTHPAGAAETNPENQEPEYFC